VTDRANFIQRALAAAQQAALEGAPISPPVAAAQAALESGFGASKLATLANNLFGIKAGARWDGPTVVLPTREWSKEQGWVTVQARWRSYASWQECFEDYGAIIGRLSWFADAAEAARRGDALGFLRGLLPTADTPGWATDPGYEGKVLAIVRGFGLI
jgi:flagellum-specific peptidoglycan hydrolase FlgJ